MTLTLTLTLNPNPNPPALAPQVLATLTALLAGNGSSRVRLRADVGYDTLLRMVLRQAGPAGPQQPLLLAVMGSVLEARRFMNQLQKLGSVYK